MSTTPRDRMPAIVQIAPDLSHAPKHTRQAVEKARRLEWDFFKKNPDATEFTRPLIPGETPEAMPPGTIVVVKRLGADHVARLVRPPSCEAN